MDSKKSEKQHNKAGNRQKFIRRFTLFIIVFAIIALAFGFSRYWSDSGSSSSNIELYSVKRGDLNISVVENGSIKPVKSVTIKAPRLSEYEVSIISIVPEGTFITPEDVNNGMVLAELDSSSSREQLPQREIDVSSAEASFAEAKENYDIRVKQNESDITAAELKVKFARMDIQKYLGQIASEKVLETASLESLSDIDMDLLLKEINDSNSLCEASQKILDLTSSITIVESDMEEAKRNLNGTQKLFDHQYASESDLKKAELQVDRQKINKEKNEISLALFKKFEFPKQVEQLLSNYLESKLSLERTESSSRSQLAQAKARLASAESSLKTRQERLKTTKEQIDSCTIKAPSPGQVVYYSSMERYVRYPIEQGAQISRGYPMIVIPDTTQLKVEIKVNETWINKIDVNQPAKITTTAFPDEVFTGKVLKKAPMADSQSSSLLADVKVYTTDVSIEGTHNYLRTGMTAKVEILIDKLKDVLYVPIQSVVTEEDDQKRVCYVMTDKGQQRREVEIGLFNDDFVEVKNGLVEGEQVMLNPPRWTETEKEEEEEQQEQKDKTEQSTEQKTPTEETKSTEDAEKTEATKSTEDVKPEETKSTEDVRKAEETKKTEKEETTKQSEEAKQTEKAEKVLESVVIQNPQNNK
jgi:HlyD family secretion protein